MPSRRPQQPQLQVPVLPAFPLSSPISEEISSPSCSSAEDRDLERTRPFDFLVKATKHKIESRSGKDGNHSPSLSHRDRHDHNKRHSIRGIMKKRKNVAKPVGLNLVTDFSLAAPPKKQPDNGPAPFVDLNDLKLLSKDRAKERSGQGKDSTFTNDDPSVIMNSSNISRKRASFHQLPEETSRIQNETANPFLDPKLENPFSDRFDHGLSPSDRHVMIGLSVPRNESSHHTREIDSAGTPLTPSIVVTPAREDAPWSTSSPEALRPRATSSIYSQPTPRLWQNGPDIPPVPAIPAEHSTKITGESDFLRAHVAAMTRKRRSMSVETLIEDDIADHGHVHESVDDNDQTALTRLSVNTQATRPESQGWWTYLLSPLLGKKSPLSPLFPRSAAPSAPSTRGTHKEWWEKEVSCFSPETPESAVPSQWQEDKKSLEQSHSLGVNDEPVSSAKRQTTTSMIFGGRPIQGEAAEYYQACAHELFSKTPYFECCNHICSITPEAVVAAIYAAQFQADEGETRDRGLIFAEAQAQQKDRSLPGTLAGNKGLLIDVDSPTEEGAKGIEHSKEINSPASTCSSDSWSSSITDENEVEHEKGLSGPTQETTRGAVPDAPAAQPVQHPPAAVPVPVPEPAPVPTAFMPEPPPPGPIPVAPAVMPEAPPPLPAPAPAPQIINTISPPTNNIHYMQPPIAMPPEPVPIERAAPQYGSAFPPMNEPPPPAPMPQEQPRAMNEWPIIPPPAAHDPTHGESTRAAPVPAPMAPFPTSEPLQENHVPPPNPNHNEPISPAFQRAAGGPGAIPMSSMNEVQAPAPAYGQHTRDEAGLPPRYALHPAPGAAIMNPTGERGPGEARRQRLEREDAIGRKIGGFWRGRACFSKKGCFGRPGREGRTKRRWYFCICMFFLIIVVLAIVLALTLTRKGDTTPVQSQWLNLTGYPPMPTGISTVAGAEPQLERSSCIKPSSLWSCALPKGQQSDNKPYAADEPNFRLEIRFRNGTYNHSTVPISSKTRRADANSWDPSPSPPSIADQTFIGNTTDGNSLPYAGEETPFYLTILSPLKITSTSLYRRSSTNDTTLFPNLTAVIPAPSENSDGTAAAATLYPLPESQPVRLYNRGKDNEHYGFYTYFDKSIFLASRAPLNGSATDSSPLDTDGGSTESDAVTRCTWSQTRFLVQIWTQPSKMGYTLVKASGNSSSSTSTSTVSTATATTSTSSPTSSSSATDYTRPGSFPYPISITIDRHGGAEKKKLLYCYGLESDQHYNITDRKLQLEDRGFGGTLVNPASGIFDDLEGESNSTSSSGYGGTDGGTGGCACRWANWVARS